MLKLGYQHTCQDQAESKQVSRLGLFDYLGVEDAHARITPASAA